MLAALTTPDVGKRPPSGMRDGAIVAQGRPETVIDTQTIHEIYGLDCVIVPDPVAGTPMVVPKSLDGDERGPQATSGRASRP